MSAPVRHLPAPSRAQRRLIERYLRAGSGTDLHRAELRKILAREG